MGDATGKDELACARDTLLERLPDAWAVYVYGSFARDDAGPGSDLDLAILLPPAHAVAEPWRLAAALGARVGRDVDFVDLRQASDVLRMQVLEHGRVLYNARPAWNSGREP